MDVLKEQMINYILSFISKREREVRKSDLFDSLAKTFSVELQEKCKDVVHSDEMFIESSIRESYIVYKLTYTSGNEKLIGLTEEGYKAAKHPKGVSGYLDDNEKKRKSSEIRYRIQFWAEIIATAVAIAGLFANLISPDTIWLNNIGYLACGCVIGIVVTRIIRTVANKHEV